MSLIGKIALALVGALVFYGWHDWQGLRSRLAVPKATNRRMTSLSPAAFVLEEMSSSWHNGERGWNIGKHCGIPSGTR